MGCLYITELDDSNIVISEIVEFDILKKEDYIELFKEKKDKGIISENTNFEDNTWVIKSKGGVETRLNLPEEIEMIKMAKLFEVKYGEFDLALRSFLLYNIDKEVKIVKLLQHLKRITKDNWKIESGHFEHMCSFIEYIKIPENNTTFKDTFEVITRERKDSATLPSFEDIFIFNDIINDIIENKGLLHYKEYILTLMWWKICSVLPLRPSEFLRTKYLCIYEEEEKFYLTVRRSKAKAKKYISNVADVDEYYFEDTVRIDSSTFDLIQTYRDLLSTEFSYNEDLELFPFEIITKKGERRGINQNLITDSDLRDNLYSFYNQVIKKDYGFIPIFKHIKKEPKIENYIEKLNPYAARHIAIINLVLIGCDILDVMRLAGHTQANTAFSYFNHVKEFSKGRALGYMKSIMNKGNLKKNNDQPEVSEYDYEIEKKKRLELLDCVLNTVNNSKQQFYKVDGGYCYYSSMKTDKTFCYLYEGDHTKCDYFKEDDKEVIRKEVEKVETELDANIKILEDLIFDMKGISKFNELYQTVSCNLSKNISDLSKLNMRLLK